MEQISIAYCTELNQAIQTFELVNRNIELNEFCSASG